MSKWTSKVMAVVWGTIIFAIMLGSYGSATLLESAEAIVGLGIAFGLAIELLNNLLITAESSTVEVRKHH